MKKKVLWNTLFKKEVNIPLHAKHTINKTATVTLSTTIDGILNSISIDTRNFASRLGRSGTVGQQICHIKSKAMIKESIVSLYLKNNQDKSVNQSELNKLAVQIAQDFEKEAKRNAID